MFGKEVEFTITEGTLKKAEELQGIQLTPDEDGIIRVRGMRFRVIPDSDAKFLQERQETWHVGTKKEEPGEGTFPCSRCSCPVLILDPLVGKPICFDCMTTL